MSTIQSKKNKKPGGKTSGIAMPDATVELASLNVVSPFKVSNGLDKDASTSLDDGSSPNKKGSFIILMMKNKMKPVQAKSINEVHSFRSKYPDLYLEYRTFDNESEMQKFIAEYSPPASVPTKSTKKKSITSSGTDEPDAKKLCAMNAFEEAARLRNCDGKYLVHLIVPMFSTMVAMVWRFVGKNGGEKWCHRYDICANALGVYVEQYKGDDSVLAGIKNRAVIEGILSEMKHAIKRDPNGSPDDKMTTCNVKKNEYYNVYQMYSVGPNLNDVEQQMALAKETTDAMKMIFKTDCFKTFFGSSVSMNLWTKMRGKNSQYFSDLVNAKVIVKVDDDISKFFVGDDASELTNKVFGTLGDDEED